MKPLLVADLFCGAGGTTTGAMQAIEEIGRDVLFVAVNHWPVAIATHTANHPNVRHYCKDLDSANPNEIVPEGELDLLLASPECRFHSPAQGGRPLDEQNRASAWHVVRWAERLYIRRIVVENVPRFVKWGPLDRKSRPIKKREGELFLAWVRALEAIGYRVEWRVLNAADYGTPQTRKRLMVQARRDGRRIVWPEQTHAQRGSEHRLNVALKTWTPARAAIKFDKYRHMAKPVQDKDLSPKTLERIAEGVRRFCRLPDAEPFLVTLRNHASSQSIDEPLTTVTASGNHHILLEPFVIPQGGGGVPRDVDDPLPTVAADGAIGIVEPFVFANRTNNKPRSVEDPMATLTTGGNMMLVEPFLLLKRQHDEVRSLEEPLPTITGSGTNHFVIEPYLVESNHAGKRATRSVEEPLPTITGKNGVGVVEPFLVAQQGQRTVKSVDEPLPTIVTQDRTTLIEPFIIPQQGRRDARSIDDPLQTIVAEGRSTAIIEPFIMPQNRNPKLRGVDEPLPTIVANGRSADLLEPALKSEDGEIYQLVLLHRMLQPEELGIGQDFEGYEFTGTREQQTKQIGNAVPVKLARAMTSAALHDVAPVEVERPAA